MRYPVTFLVIISFVSVLRAEDAFIFSALDFHSDLVFVDAVPTSGEAEHGIKEVVPREYKPRYEKWKRDFLATQFGRDLWDRYASNDHFLLTMKVSGSRKNGAATGDFQWDDNGKLIAATVTLGKDLDKGFPDPVYYPVMNSLGSQSEAFPITSDLLASTKIAHEIGHVSFTEQINEQLFQKQNRLIENYYNIFLKNGFNTRDPRLISLETELGARPLDIWEDREYWSEVSALRYLVQRIDRESYYCAVLNKIRLNVAEYAGRYRDRFDLTSFASRPICGN
jgi:hypothetical protein